MELDAAMVFTSLAILVGAVAVAVVARRPIPRPVTREVCVQTDYTRRRHWQTPRFDMLRDVEHGVFLVEEGRVRAFPCHSTVVAAWGAPGSPGSDS